MYGKSGLITPTFKKIISKTERKHLKMFLDQECQSKMFGLFKRKSEKDKLEELYRKKKEQAFRMSRTNRKEGDRLEAQANEILNKIDKLK